MLVTSLGFSLLQMAFYLVLFTFLALTLKEIISYINISFYKKQGIKCYFVPWKGKLPAFQQCYIPSTSRDPRYKVFNFYNENKKEKVIAANTPYSTHPILYLADPDILQDFWAKDGFCFKRDEIVHAFDYKQHNFSYLSGDKALNMKSHYAQYFSNKNIEKFGIIIEKVFDEEVAKVVKEIKPASDQGKWTKVNLLDTFTHGFDRISNLIILGELDPKDVPEINGLKFTLAIDKYFALAFGQRGELIHRLTGGYSTHLFLTKKAREVKKLRNGLEKVLTEIYNHRFENWEAEKTKRPLNMMDMMIEKNIQFRNQPSKQVPMEELFEVLTGFYLAGTDTAQNNSKHSLRYLMADQNMQDSIASEIKAQISSQNPEEGEMRDIDRSELLNNFSKESLRIVAPSANLMPRVAVKNCKIGDIKVKKGTIVYVALSAFHNDPEVWENPTKFDMNRFAKPLRPKTRKSYFPFARGKRGCVGQYLGECLVKLMLISLLKNFKMRKPEGHEHTVFCRFTYAMHNVYSDLKLRE